MIIVCNPQFQLSNRVSYRRKTKYIHTQNRTILQVHYNPNVMDPWLELERIEENENPIKSASATASASASDDQSPSTSSGYRSPSDKFEDNFDAPLQRLPDSDEYLETLEKKLAKIRRDPDVVKQLSAKREQCMIELLENTDTLQYSTFEEPIDNSHSFIYRSFYPQRVAIKRGEIIGLVKNDQFNTSDKDESD